MPRYLHMMGAISSEKGESQQADAFFREACFNQPNNIMARNDFAVHLAREDRKEHAIQELRKGLLQVDGQNATLQKNMAAVRGRSGDFLGALENATQARYLNPNDAMNHRNLAKIHEALGDTRTALSHNMQAIALENPNEDTKTKSAAYRAAAVQIIAKGGGDYKESYALMDAARATEGKTFQLSTTIRTNEIIKKIRQQKQYAIANAEKRRKEELEEMERKKKEDRLREFIEQSAPVIEETKEEVKKTTETGRRLRNHKQVKSKGQAMLNNEA